MQAHSPVCSTLELHKNKSLTVFSCDGKVGRGGGGGGSMFQEVGVCLGFQRGVE